MRRNLFSRFFLLIESLVTIGLVVLWPISYRNAPPGLHWRSLDRANAQESIVALNLVQGRAEFVFGYERWDRPARFEHYVREEKPPPGLRLGYRSGFDPPNGSSIWNRVGFALQEREGRVRWGRDYGWSLMVPLGMPVFAAAAYPAWYTTKWVIARQRRPRTRLQLCARCGYDLRASTERCPECGTPISRMAASKSEAMG